MPDKHVPTWVLCESIQCPKQQSFLTNRVSPAPKKILFFWHRILYVAQACPKFVTLLPLPPVALGLQVCMATTGRLLFPLPPYISRVFVASSQLVSISSRYFKTFPPKALFRLLLAASPYFVIIFQSCCSVLPAGSYSQEGSTKLWCWNGTMPMNEPKAGPGEDMSWRGIDLSNILWAFSTWRHYRVIRLNFAGCWGFRGRYLTLLVKIVSESKYHALGTSSIQALNREHRT